MLSYFVPNENGGNSHELRISARIPSVHNNTGIGQSRVIETDENGEKIRNLWPFDPDIDALVKSVAPSAAR